MKLFVSAILVALVTPTCKVGLTYIGFNDDACKTPSGVKFIAGPNEAAQTGKCAGTTYTGCSDEAFFTHTFPKKECQGKEASYQEFPYGKCTKTPDGKFAIVTAGK